MRLLNTSTLEVEEFLQSRVPEYVILSHTWKEEEVTLHDLVSGVASSKKGYAKLMGCCKKAKDDGFKYCWVDTCCIDKTSSAELSEAINSMYQWYKGACICYAYLEDLRGDPQLDDYGAFSRSLWFTRGWTLQELIAPQVVEFYNTSWADIGTRSSLQEQLTHTTGINAHVLSGGNPLMYSVAVRMSWAAQRQTSRLEDQAYCLLGIFGVNMPLLYGEGERAFLRLQEEILRINEDYTLFAWDTHDLYKGLLAPSPSEFSDSIPRLDCELYAPKDDGQIRRENLSRTCFSIFPPPRDHSPPYLTSRGIYLTLPLRRHEGQSWYCLLTMMQYSKKDTYLLCIRLSQISYGENQYERDFSHEGALVLLPVSSLNEFRYTSIYLNTSTVYKWKAARNPRVYENPTVVRVALDPPLLREVTSISTSLTNLRSFYERQIDSVSPPLAELTTEDRMVVFDRRPVKTINTSLRDKEIAKALRMEDENVVGIGAGVPDLCFVHSFSREISGDVFRFRFVPSVGVDLIIQFGVARKPYIIAETQPSEDSSSEIRCLVSGTTRNASDRAIVQIQHPTHSEDPGWCIRASIRRAGSMAFAPTSRQYVLTLTGERMLI